MTDAEGKGGEATRQQVLRDVDIAAASVGVPVLVVVVNRLLFIVRILQTVEIIIDTEKTGRPVVRKVAGGIFIDTTLREFSAGLRAYSREESSKKNDIRVRQSWGRIEDLLREFGRKI